MIKVCSSDLDHPVKDIDKMTPITVIDTRTAKHISCSNDTNEMLLFALMGSIRKSGKMGTR